jgi:sugar phosphate isomerase/epimerase
MRLGVGSYTFVWAVGVPGYEQPPEPLTAAKLLDLAAELGVGLVQIADNLPLDRLTAAERQSLLRQAEGLGIGLEVGTCGIRPEHLRTYLRIASELRSPLLRVVIDTEDEQPAVDDIVQSLGQVLPDFESAGVTLAIENHDRFPAAVLASLIERCGSPRLGICLDTANSLGCGEDLQTVLRVLGPWIVNLHIKDFTARRLPHNKGFIVEGCPAGEGLVNVPRLLAELQRLGRDASAILELWPPPEATIQQSIAKELDWTRRSLRYLRGYIAQ